MTASDRKPGDTPYYGANGIQDYVEGFTHNGEFILVAEDGANDLKNYPVQYVNGKVWVNNHAHVLQGKKTITDNKFLMNAIKNFNIEPFLVGGGRAKLNADVMMKLNILLPTFVEQEKIGSLFSLLDKTIALHQRKLKLLKVMKKALSQYMFCQETEFVPILRFNSFSDKWKYERLKKLIIKEIKGKAKADMKGTKSTYIDTALLNGGSITKVDSPTDTFHNDIIILWDGSQAGKIYHGFTGALGSTLKSYKPKYSGGFLYQYLKSKEPIIFLRYRTPNIPHVVKDFTEIFKINVPSVKEQEKISKTLNYLDQSILVETKKIGSIKKIKKFLLQNMFI
nr:restriction endonuclease subunit S [Lactobacillus helveticus]